MTQKLFNLDKWTKLDAGDRLDLPGDRYRCVRLHVNVPTEAHLSYVDLDGEIVFLATVVGRDSVEFYVDGKCSILTDTDDTFVYTADGESIHHVAEAPESFARIMEKRARNPDLERIAALMQQNMQSRLDAQAAEYERLIERRFAAREALLEASRAAPTDGGEQQPASEAGGSVGEAT